jgi:N6-L-threonylcarbamoyladenine synthase
MPPRLGRDRVAISHFRLKTAVRHITAQRGCLDPRDRADLAASVELAICDALADRTANAIAWFHRHHPDGKTLVAAGGSPPRRCDSTLPRSPGAALRFVAPPPSLCTDNGARIAWAGLERFRLGLVDGLDAPLRPRWQLDAGAPPRRGAGIKA